MARRTKKLWIGLGVLLVVLALLAVLWFKLFPPRWAVERYVLGHQEELDAYVQRLLETDPAQLEDYHGYSAGDTYDGWDVTYYPHSGMIEFQTSAFGLVPSSTYSGFYYSPEDVPMGFQSAQVDFAEHGDGWLWEEPEGDNRQYTQRITEHWYWYDVRF